ncbi:unnamed protein product [Caenorhabditis bovis]|uniref:Guanylate cyclase n=1 Tax=Caenorhabditis bovis TaxID=2654633 RepID=A0A8S1EGS7_9PELO|nr:unnamed protein product [Caenorhabditis bovis]
MLLLLYFLIWCCEAQKVIKVGLLFTKDVQNMLIAAGYRTSAGAVLIARDRIRDENILPGYDFEFVYRFDECVEHLAMGKAIELIEDEKVDMIIGPTCNKAGRAVAAIGSYYNIPVFQWALATSADLGNFKRYPTTVTLTINSYNVALALRDVMLRFNWYEFVYVYSDDGDAEKCDTLGTDINSLLAETENLTMSYLYKIETMTMPNIRRAVREIAKRGRIVVGCFAAGFGFRKAFLSAVYKEGAFSDEFVYIFAETKSRGFYIDELGGGVHFAWEENSTVEDDTMTVEGAKRAYYRVMFLCDNMGLPLVWTDYFTNFTKQVVARIRDPPFNCVDDCSSSNYSAMATYAGQLFDALYCYALALNRTIAKNGPNFDYKNTSEILKNIGMTFTGVGGDDVQISETGGRAGKIYMFALNESRLPEVMAVTSINNSGVFYLPYYSDESELWRSGIRPLAVPLCGFLGNECPVNLFRDYLAIVIIVIVVIVLLILAAICGVLYTFHLKKQEIARQDLIWQIQNAELQKIKAKSKAEASVHSFASGPSTSTKLTIESKNENDHFEYFAFQQEIVAARHYEIIVELGKEEKQHLRSLCILDHDNINKFIGLCMNSLKPMSIWSYCSRGALADVITQSSMQMDGFFVFSLIRDIANGIGYIHSSFLQCHGRLSSRCCLIDERWQIKISEYGLDFFTKHEKLPKKELLWVAPEFLRNDSSPKTKEGDIYSFGIICSEIVSKTSAYDMENRREKVEEIIYLVKKGGFNAIRPELKVDENVDLNPALLHLIRDCWTEKPSERPTIEQVKSLLRGMSDGRKANLMDHVFNMLETYASTLEDEVSERTKELVEEKKKSDVLLYRMLPKAVADKLKLGQTVEPETFEMVTIFFSDVVKFTLLASKCSPIQVVNLVNDLYTMFDGIIEQHDVYKVETIGDGYLCVSGLPHRNGNEHCRHIARLALGFMSSLDFFRIPHLPGERINLRIGLNSGSVVAGVVGLAMPRFCLFGDAVNTASRMESNGKPGKIHISAEVNHLLTKVVGGFETESRGDVIIKGKGVMETFWLLGETGSTSYQGIIKEAKSESPRSVTPRMSSAEPIGMYTDFKSTMCPTRFCVGTRSADVIVDEMAGMDEYGSTQISFGSNATLFKIDIEEKQRCEGLRKHLNCVNIARMVLLHCRHRFCYDCLAETIKSASDHSIRFDRTQISQLIASESVPHCPLRRCANTISFTEVNRI